MDRRNYLALMGGTTVLLLSGCSESKIEETNQTTSTTATTTGTPEFEVISVEAPDSVERGESFQVEVEIENVGEAEGFYSDSLETEETRGEKPTYFSGSIPITANLESGESHTWRSNSFSFEEPTVFFYRLNSQEDDSIEEVDIPGSRAPIIQATNLVSEWEEFGDAITKSTNKAEVGSYLNIASRYWNWVEKGTQDSFVQVEVYDDEYKRVGINQRDTEQLTDNNGWNQWEWYLSINSEGWDPGVYTAEMIIRDNQNGEVSEAGKTAFELVEEIDSENQDDAFQELAIPQSYTADLDSGVVSPEDGVDIWLQAKTETERYLSPGLPGNDDIAFSQPQSNQPSEEECKSLDKTNEKISLDNIKEGDWFCVDTSEDNYSMVKVENIEDSGAVHILFKTLR